MAKFKVRMRGSDESLQARFTTDNELSVSFGGAQVIQGGNIQSDTTAGWDSQRDLVGELNTIYVYTDHSTTINEDGSVTLVPGIKIGDGMAYLIDLPFVDVEYDDHIRDTDMHVTPEEKEFWNNKNRAYVSEVESENLVLTAD